MAESKRKQLAFSLYFFLHMRYAYTGLKHPRSFWVLTPGLPLYWLFQALSCEYSRLSLSLIAVNNTNTKRLFSRPM